MFEDKALADQAVHAVEKAVGLNGETRSGEKNESVEIQEKV